MDEVTTGFEATEWAVYKAVEEGRLKRYGRPGRQAYYLEDEVAQLFPRNGHNGGGDSTKPAKDEQLELETAA